MSEEVKVNIRTEADNRGAIDAKAKIVELREEAARLRQSAEVYSTKGGFEDPRARTARSEAAAREREANRLERPINTAEKTAQKAERDEKAKALREQRSAEQAAIAEARASTRAAAREAAEEKKKFAAEDKAEKTAAGAAQRDQQKAATAAEREQRKTAVAEKKQEHEEETRRQRFGRVGMQIGMQAAQGGSLTGGIGSMASAMGPAGMAGAAAVAAVAVGKIVDEVWTDITERRGIALRDQAARRMNQYDRGVSAGVRGTSGQSRAAEVGLEREIEERAANRAELERKGERNPWNPLRWFGSKQTFESQRELKENDVAQTRDKTELEEKRKQTRDKFANEEGGLELDALRQRAKRSQSGQREAFMDDYLAKALQVKRQFEAKGATPQEQNEAARLEMTNSLRDRQNRAGASLVDARSGASDIAAAARWGGQTTPSEGEMVKRLDRIIGRMDEQTHQQKTVNQSVK